MFLLACKLKLGPHNFLLEFQEGIGWKGLDTVHVLEKLICILIETWWFLTAKSFWSKQRHWHPAPCLPVSTGNGCSGDSGSKLRPCWNVCPSFDAVVPKPNKRLQNVCCISGEEELETLLSKDGFKEDGQVRWLLSQVKIALGHLKDDKVWVWQLFFFLSVFFVQILRLFGRWKRLLDSPWLLTQRRWLTPRRNKMPRMNIMNACENAGARTRACFLTIVALCRKDFGM